MKFRWDQAMPPELSVGKPPPVWVYAALYLVIEVSALLLTVSTWPKGQPVASQEFVLHTVILPLLASVFIGIFAYHGLHGSFAYQVAVTNSERWHLITRWQRQSRSGVAVLDSTILTPEPDLAVHMLGLEGTPPENPARIMALDSVEGADGASRVRAVLHQLLTPLIPGLVGAVRSRSFDLVLQCERQESSEDVRAIWKELELPGDPRVRWINNEKEVDFADGWFEDDRHMSYGYEMDRTPRYRLLLAWHLNDGGPDARPTFSESAVALLLGTATLAQEKQSNLRQQAWLLRQIVGDADLADRSLALLLDAEQVPRERIHHFWHSRLKGLAQHATMGAVGNSGLKVGEHALDRAVGPQASVARWVLQALAARMAHFGQGAQLVALPRSNGVALNFVVKERTPVSVRWKPEYEYSLFPLLESVACMTFVALALLLSDSKAWGTYETVTVSVGAFFCVLFAGARILMRRVFTDNFWRAYR
ncbi:hypothetical protein AB4Y32_33005 [Paraburkholderia phymatum]|uniref:Uncharacterized protein n=1 Tax=Paraburkholderia phymatum TaxID=148447 RepID=A0ACC6UAL4_9BURK